jgi:pimeloyl-ACP methyl ester carboxylesterase
MYGSTPQPWLRFVLPAASQFEDDSSSIRIAARLRPQPRKWKRRHLLRMRRALVQRLARRATERFSYTAPAMTLTGKTISLVLAAVLLPCCATAQTAAPASPATNKTALHYGSNAAAGRYFTHDGIKLYYEVYGNGEPLLVIHGNGGSISDMSAQIAHFRRRYKVIAMDSRDQGKSADSAGDITYEKMTDDLAALLDHLKVGSANVLGWSDGGIEALLLGVRHPAKVKKIAAMAANLNPSDKALHPEAVTLIKTMVAETPVSTTASPQAMRERKVTQMMLREPNIDPKMLESITAPTLILAGDHDVIADEHTVEIFHHVPNSQLCIFPDATHMIPYDEPARFNSTVERFFRMPFVKKDRIKGLMTSLEAMRARK